MRELFEELVACLSNQSDAVLVSVVASSGSTPRGVGARMLVSKDRRLVGTIGGGAIEYRCQQLAADVLNGKKGKLEHFTLAPNEVADLGMICGGNAQVLFQYIPATSEMLALCQQVLKEISEKSEAWLVAEIDSVREGLSIYSSTKGWLGESLSGIPVELIENGQEHLDLAGHKYFVESLVSLGKILIFGGGHVSQALVPVLSALDFYCVVFEDRQDFLTQSLFPTANELILGDFLTITNKLKIGNDDYALVMTRGHQFDFLLQEQLLQTQARYIGVMGSKRKVAVQIEKLKEAGFSDQEIKRITMPIGLPIKAETPAELAISIAGQLIMERATK